MNIGAKRSMFAVSAVAAMAAGVVMVLPGHGLSLVGAGGHTAVTSVAAGQTQPADPGQGGSGTSHTGTPGGGTTGAGATGTGNPGMGTGQSGAGQGGTGQGGTGTGNPGMGGTGQGGSGTGGSGTGGAGTGGTGTGGTGAGQGGPPPATGHLKVLGSLRPGFPPAGLELPVVTALPSPSGTIGDPNVPCLNGYVWRQAYAGDYVCVTAGVRAQAAADNAAATSRIQAGGGAYGQYTCQQGYVWRQTVPDDYTCVTPDVRAQAAADNAQAGNRVALLRLWLTDWTPPAQQPQENCSNGTCTTTEGGWDGPNFKINGDHFNFGHVFLEIRSNGGAVLWSALVADGSYPGYAGGAFGVQTGIGDCSSVPGTTNNDYAIAFDAVSGRWSNEVPLDSDCASL